MMNEEWLEYLKDSDLYEDAMHALKWRDDKVAKLEAEVARLDQRNREPAASLNRGELEAAHTYLLDESIRKSGELAKLEAENARLVDESAQAMLKDEVIQSARRNEIELRQHIEKLESAALEAAQYLQRKEAGQCANELAHKLLCAVDGVSDVPV